MSNKIEISHKTIIFTVLFLVFLWFIFQIKQIIFWIFIAFILMSALKPIVESLEKLRIPRILSILIVYLLLIATIIITGSSIVPPMVIQTIHLIDRLPNYLQVALPFIQLDPKAFIGQIAPLSESIVRVTVSVFSNIIVLLTILVLSIYMLIERKKLDTFLSKFLKEESIPSILRIIVRVEERLGAWVRGQIVLGLAIGLMTFVGLMILNLPYVLPLAIIAGFLEIVPNIGPVISGIPAVLIALTISPLVALATIAVYFLIHQFENHIIVPLVMNKVVGLPPLVTIVAMLIGAKLAGIGGMLLAIPIVVSSETIITEWLKMKESR